MNRPWTDREGPIHKACLDYLRTQYPRALIHHSPNENSMTGKDVARLISKNKDMGMMPGFPDILMLHNGRFYGFEVKAEGNTQQENQKDAQRLIEANGGVYAVVRSIDDVMEVMRAAPSPWRSIGDIAAGMVEGVVK
ncbi:VRR-NUC domain-containing protein [Maritimibacter sp. UBA3975]|uniref:VRR-NUC domain-containing protein n=1 Tax=Maritimibacter sp. UBA3975 TaxID=1946833 RepID=UPI000C0AFF4E|nr:VRR-NUC domain-containing protein [Maritimibacter sp. UBA3975]MAM60844.1 VRR-NUC domain-containing protein [Maritimibacter sp.]